MDDRRRGFSSREQLATLAPLLAVWAVGIGVLALVLLRDADERAALFLDPNHVARLPWWVGTYAQAGAAIWAIALTSAAFGWMLVRTAGRPAATRFLGGGAAVCALMLSDSILHLHTAVLPKFLHLPKLVILVAYGVGVLAWLGTNVAEILRTRWQVLAAALFALGSSILIDAALSPVDGIGVLIEDAPKFLGTLGMATYFAVTTRDIARSVVRRPAPLTATDVDVAA